MGRTLRAPQLQLKGTPRETAKDLPPKIVSSAAISTCNSRMSSVAGRAQWRMRLSTMMHGQRISLYPMENITSLMQGIQTARSCWFRIVDNAITWLNGGAQARYAFFFF